MIEKRTSYLTGTLAIVKQIVDAAVFFRVVSECQSRLPALADSVKALMDAPEKTTGAVE